jgi:hypothetical protein
MEYLGTIVVAIIIAAIVAAIIIKLVRDKRAGKGCAYCDCSCETCKFDKAFKSPPV